MARLSPDRRRTRSAEAQQMGAARPTMRRLVWLLPLVVALMIAGGAWYQYAGPPAAGRQMYLATQRMRVEVPVEGATSAYDVYVAAQAEDATARALTSGLLQKGALDATIVSEYATERVYASPAAATLDAHAGVPARLSPSEVAGALTATHAGNLVTLAVRWRTDGGARALLAATVAALTSSGVPIPAGVYPSAVAGPSASLESASIRVDGPASGAVPDPSVATAARQTLYTRLGFAAAAGLLALLAIVVARRVVSDRSGHTDQSGTSTFSTPSSTQTG